MRFHKWKCFQVPAREVGDIYRNSPIKLYAQQKMFSEAYLVLSRIRECLLGQHGSSYPIFIENYEKGRHSIYMDHLVHEIEQIQLFFRKIMGTPSHSIKSRVAVEYDQKPLKSSEFREKRFLRGYKCVTLTYCLSRKINPNILAVLFKLCTAFLRVIVSFDVIVYQVTSASSRCSQQFCFASKLIHDTAYCTAERLTCFELPTRRVINTNKPGWSSTRGAV